jgi:hypothetical protein
LVRPDSGLPVHGTVDDLVGAADRHAVVVGMDHDDLRDTGLGGGLRWA